MSDCYNNLSPIGKGIASVFTVPLLAIIMVLTAIVLLIAWPLIPFMVYLENKKKKAKP